MSKSPVLLCKYPPLRDEESPFQHLALVLGDGTLRGVPAGPRPSAPARQATGRRSGRGRSRGALGRPEGFIETGMRVVIGFPTPSPLQGWEGRAFARPSAAEKGGVPVGRGQFLKHVKREE